MTVTARDFRTECAELWQQILRSDVDELFGLEASKLQRRHYGDALAQPGYVGSRYRAGGVVFVGMNPGAGGDGLGDVDKQQYSALESLRDASARGLNVAFASLNASLREIMLTWKIYRVFVAPIISGASMTFDDVAYLNLLKWRTNPDNALARLYDLSWSAHTSTQIGLLAPRTIVAVGLDAARALKRHPVQAAVHEIPRVIGNNIDERGRAAIAHTVAALANRA